MKKYIALASALFLSFSLYAEMEKPVTAVFDASSDSSTVVLDTLGTDSIREETLQLVMDSDYYVASYLNTMNKLMENERHLHYINFYVGGGLNNLSYVPNGGVWGFNNQPFNDMLGLLGCDFRLQYQYMMTRRWGFSLSAQGSLYQSYATYNFTHTRSNLTHPGNGQLYNLSLDFQNWKESQLLVQVEVPIMFHYMCPTGENGEFSLGFGASIGFPVYNSYKTSSGSFSTKGYFPSTNIEYSDMIQHGFGSTDYGVKGSTNFNMLNVGAVIDLGFNIKMTERSDFYIGLYGGYYFMNSITPSKNLLVNLPSSSSEELQYNGTLASDRVETVHPFNAGLRIGFRFRVDKPRNNSLNYDSLLQQSRKTLEKLQKQHLKDSTELALAYGQIRKSGESEDEFRARVALTIHQKDSIDRLFKALQAEHDSLLLKKAEVVERKRIEGHINSIAYFDTAKDFPHLTDEDKEILKRLAELMKENPNVWVVVYGHADNVGSAEMNIIYGHRRAIALRNVLVKYGADTNRIICVSRGEEAPVASNDTEMGRCLNRRAEIDITEKE